MSLPCLFLAHHFYFPGQPNGRKPKTWPAMEISDELAPGPSHVILSISSGDF